MQVNPAVHNDNPVMQQRNNQKIYIITYKCVWGVCMHAMLYNREVIKRIYNIFKKTGGVGGGGGVTIITLLYIGFLGGNLYQTLHNDVHSRSSSHPEV